MRAKLSQFIDENYKKFQQKLIFTKYEILGVRAFYLQKIAKNLQKEAKFEEFFDKFLRSDDKFFEYLQIIAYGINYEKDYQKAINYSKKYLEFVDNWANCDTLSPKSFDDKNILEFVDFLLKNDEIYLKRFGILCLFRHFNIDFAYPILSSIKSDEYYVQMAVAWAFQSFFAKDFQSTFSHFQNSKIDKTIAKMTLQKCRDSQRLNSRQKAKIQELLYPYK